MASSGSEGQEAPAPARTPVKIPVRYCAVYNCLNNYRTHPNLSFFGFPQDKERVKLWLERIRRPDILQPDGRVSNYYRVCETHFETRHIHPNRRRRRLLQRAVPARNLPHTGPYVNVQGAEPPAEPPRLEVRGRALVRSTLEVFDYVDAPKRKTRKRRRTDDLKPATPPAAPPALGGFFADCDRHLAPSAADFVKNVARLQAPGADDLCLKLLHASPRAYRLLRPALGLPSVASLHRRRAHLLPDFDERLTALLKTRVDRMTEKERHCTLGVEFVDVRPHLYYNITLDRIVGLHEVGGEQSPRAAARAAAVTARGLLAAWTQPVALCFLAERDEAFDRLIEKIVRLLRAVGLEIHALVGDPAAAAPRPAGVSPRRPSFRVDDAEIYFVYDPPRLMKSLLCSFQAYDFCFEKSTASWSDVLVYRKIEKNKPLTLTPGLTEEGTEPEAVRRMRPERAARVLSRALAAALSSYADRQLLPERARGTVTFILKINNLLDILGSATTRPSSERRGGPTGDPAQIGFLTYMKSFFKTLKLEDSLGVDREETRRLTESWQITIAAVLALREKLKPRSLLPTRRLHLDGRVADAVRRGRGARPTCREVFAAFKRRFFEDMLEPPGAETDVDLNGLLAKLASEAGASGANASSLDEEVPRVKVRPDEYRAIRLPGRGAVAAAARHLLRAARREHGSCEAARRYAAAPPRRDLLQLVERLDEALVSLLRPGGAPARALLGDLLLDVHVLDCELPCECFPLEYLKQLFLRLRLYRILKHNQARFRRAGPGDELRLEINTL